MMLTESGLNFSFRTEKVTKFDEIDFFMDKYQKLKDSKGVDFIAVDDNTLFLIEVKNFTGHEKEQITKQRLKVRNPDIESLDVEVALEVRSSLACLIGGKSKGHKTISPYYDTLNKNIDHYRPIKIILFLEGDVAPTLRAKAQMFNAIGTSIKRQLAWIDAEVMVESSETRRYSKYYTVG